MDMGALSCLVGWCCRFVLGISQGVIDKIEKLDSDLALYSASEWLTRLATKEEYQTDENPQLVERKALHNIFFTTATSFDEAYLQVIDLAIKKYNTLQETINKHIETNSKETSTYPVCITSP